MEIWKVPFLFKSLTQKVSIWICSVESCRDPWVVCVGNTTIIQQYDCFNAHLHAEQKKYLSKLFVSVSF
jgi:hypothetical protein